jgi:hypothetical protein
MNALLILVIAGFTGLFSLIGFRRAQVIESAKNVDPNLLPISAQEFTIAGIFFGTATLILVTLSVVIAILNRVSRG